MRPSPFQSQKELVIKGKKYKINSVVGQGSFGKVYLASTTEDQQQYAIKEQNMISDEELKLCQKLVTKRFKNLVNLFAIEQNPNGKIYMVMEYCSSSIFDKIQQKTFDPQQMRFVMKEIANGIKELHDMQLAHRDLKPENILIQILPLESGQVQERYKICDFGTVKQHDRLQTKQVGTPYYLAPEQLNGNENYTLKADIWSFGAMCYELLTNKPLFDGTTVKEIEKKIINLNIDEYIDKLKHLEKEQIDLMKLMLQRNPENRCDINYVISILVSTTNTSKASIRTKSINRTNVQKIEIFKPPKPEKLMGENESAYLQKVSNFKSTMQHPPATKITIEQKPSLPFKGITLQKGGNQNLQNPVHIEQQLKFNQYQIQQSAYPQSNIPLQASQNCFQQKPTIQKNPNQNINEMCLFNDKSTLQKVKNSQDAPNINLEQNKPEQTNFLNRPQFQNNQQGQQLKFLPQQQPSQVQGQPQFVSQNFERGRVVNFGQKK